MPHIIEPIYNQPIKEAVKQLKHVYHSIVASVSAQQLPHDKQVNNWGITLKRLEIELPKNEKLIGKQREKFIEIINILATTERTISALHWFAQKYPYAIVQECHSSTSDNPNGSDIVLINESQQIIVRCEVTDVASSNASQNGKEIKDLKNLGCKILVPQDSIARYIATSQEFADALASTKRKWSKYHYKYTVHQTDCKNNTTLLEILPKNEQ